MDCFIGALKSERGAAGARMRVVKLLLSVLNVGFTAVLRTEREFRCLLAHAR